MPGSRLALPYAFDRNMFVRGHGVVGKALDCNAGGPGFNSHHPNKLLFQTFSVQTVDW